jgi:RNA polymerase-associated protein LEO1
MRQVRLVRMRNILGVEVKPFDESTYVREEPLESFVDMAGKQRQRARKETKIRWRFAVAPGGERILDENGKPRIETNTRYVKWSDGSCHLMVGNEILVASEQPLGTENSHLFLDHDGRNVVDGEVTGEKAVMTCEGILLKKFTVRTSTTDSEAHRKIAAGVHKSYAKANKVKVTTDDPAKELRRLEQAEAEKSKYDQKIESKRRRNSQKSGLTQSYLENDGGSDDEEMAVRSKKGDDEKTQASNAKRLAQIKKNDTHKRLKGKKTKSKKQQASDSSASSASSEDEASDSSSQADSSSGKAASVASEASSTGGAEKEKSSSDNRKVDPEISRQESKDDDAMDAADAEESNEEAVSAAADSVNAAKAKKRKVLSDDEDE